MKKNKRIFTLCLSSIFIISLFQTSIYASDVDLEQFSVDESVTMLETTELSMPSVSKNPTDYKLNSEFNTLSLSERALWCEQTEDSLEGIYQQEISSVSETQDYIVFEFDVDENADLTSEQVLLVKYLKPESPLAVSGYDTKFTYTYGWNSKYYTYDEKSGKWSRIKSLLISLVSGADMPVVGLLSQVYDGIDSILVADTEVDVDSLYKTYFLNETCAVKEQNYQVWLPYVNVGCRKDFVAGCYTTYDSEGQPFMHTPQTIKVGSPSKNPTNQDRYLESKHYDDFSWMQKKAIELYKSDGIAYNEVFGYPDKPHITDSKP